MTEQIVIKMSGNELKEILCKRFDLQHETAKVTVTPTEVNGSEPESVEVTITAERTKKTDFTEAYYNK